MAFRASTLARVGGFDVALGPGTASLASEDTRFFTDVLCTGGTVVYQPTAVTLHFHRRSLEELRSQTFGYGVGLTAFYTSLVLHRPQCVPELIHLVPRTFRDLFGCDSLRIGGLPSAFPSELRRAKRRGMLIGPVSYIEARVDAALLARKPEGRVSKG